MSDLALYLIAGGCGGICGTIIARAVLNRARRAPVDAPTEDGEFDASAARWGYLQDKRNG